MAGCDAGGRCVQPATERETCIAERGGTVTPVGLAILALSFGFLLLRRLATPSR
ncbi:MAG: hypothetical protein WEE50_03545 [Chloroflexota bacterium]